MTEVVLARTIRHVVEGLNDNKAVEPDDISPLVLPFLGNMFSHSFAKGFFPLRKNCSVKQIPKIK